MPLSFPLSPADDVILRAATEACFEYDGNEFDAAAAFMTVRIKSELEAEVAVGRRPGLLDARKEMGRLAVGLQRTSGFVKRWDLHMKTLGEINALRDRANQVAAGEG
jgi:hypothetical protein